MSHNNTTINYPEILKTQLDTEIQVGGFVHSIRDHGGLIFIDLRSQNDLLQVVVEPENQTIFHLAESLRNEFVIQVTGKLRKREADLVNPNILTGELELVTKSLEIISEAKTLPFDIHSEHNNLAGEDTRLKYRYLDLRRSKLKNLFKLKSDFVLNIRNFFQNNDFIDINTPILANSTPEGARDFLVPSRLHPGKFYALPQAPQQFKQLLMVAGFNKYYQIAPCFRDEDPRADRHPGDFYQIDAELAWADENTIYDFCQRFITEVLSSSKFTDKKLMSGEVLEKISYFEAMDKYGSDKPDLRYDLAWQDAKEVFRDSDFKVFADLCGDDKARVQALVIKNSVDKFSRSDLDRIQAIGREYGLPGIAYAQYFAEGAKSPIFKFLGEAKTQELQSYFGLETGDLILFIANQDRNIVWQAQNKMRTHIAQKLNLIDDSVLKFVWIEAFPMFEKDEKTGEIDFEHNPFTAWKGGLKALQTAVQNNTLEDLTTRGYDIAVNGYEVLSGGVRNTDSQSQLEVMKVAGYSESEIKNKFGHMLDAYSYGSPTHAGFAWGLDRLFMVLTGEENIREIIAFPKNGKAMDTMLNSPAEVSKDQLQDLNIKIEE